MSSYYSDAFSHDLYKIKDYIPQSIYMPLKPERLLLQKQNKTLHSSNITACLLCAWYSRRLEYICAEFEFYYENSNKYKYKHIKKHTTPVKWEFNGVS